MTSVQHYEWPNPFHRTRAKFEAQVKRDILKLELCKVRGVRLIVVPHTVQRTEIEAFLVTQLVLLEGVTLDREVSDGAYRATVTLVPAVPTASAVLTQSSSGRVAEAGTTGVTETTGLDLTS